MVTHVIRGGISEFVWLAAETFDTTTDSAERAVRRLLVQLVEAGPGAGVDCLLDHVPGSRDMVFAELLARSLADLDDAAPRPDVVPAADLFALFLSYCSAHAGVDCASRLLAAAYRVNPPTTGR